VCFATASFGQWTTTGTNISNNNTGNVGIGTTAPASRLSVSSGATASPAPDLRNSVTVGAVAANSTNRYLGQFGFVSADPDFTLPKIVAYILGEATETYGDNTSTGSAMRFFTGANDGSSPSERMVIDNFGNVGIGNASPAANLPGGWAAGVGSTILSLNGGTTNADAGLQIYNKAQTLGLNIWQRGTVNDGTAYIDNIWSNNLANTVFRMRTAGTPVNLLTLSARTRIGINNLTPSSLLDITSTATGGAGGLILRSSTGTGNAVAVMQDDGDTGTLILKAAGTTAVNLSATGDSYFNAGNVGVGTTDTQGYKFAVNGTIHSKEVKVDMTGWPDHVFKKEYRLWPLTEVKRYIDANGHLPEMPSEEQVAKEGLDLGEMNKLLTKKVEELTLYLIEQDKRIQKLERALKKN